MKMSSGRSGHVDDQLTSAQRRILLAGGLAVGLAFLDETAVVTALPTIQREFDAIPASLQWVMGAYLLALASLIVAGGRLADLYGRRRLLLIGVGLFGLGSILCALSPNEDILVASRAVQGCGGALLIPLGIANAIAALPEGRRGWVLGIITTTATVFLALGPVVGGALVELASWRWIFVINLPALALIGLIAIRSLPETRSPDPPPLDIVGLGLLVAGLVPLVLAIIGAESLAPPIALALGGAGIGVLAGFAMFELRAEFPLIDLRLLRIRVLSGSLWALFVLQFAILGVTVYVTMYLQNGLGYSPATAGLLVLPTVAVSPLISAQLGRMTDRRGARGLLSGAMLLAAVALALIAALADARMVLILLPAFLLFGIARPIALVAGSTAAIGAIRKEDSGLASGLATEARQLGAVMGVAVLGLVITVLESARRSSLLSRVDSSFDTAQREALDGILAGSSKAQALLDALPSAAREAAHQAATAAFIDAFQWAMAITAALAFTAAVLSWVQLKPSGSSPPSRHDSGATPGPSPSTTRTDPP